MNNYGKPMTAAEIQERLKRPKNDEPLPTEAQLNINVPLSPEQAKAINKLEQQGGTAAKMYVLGVLYQQLHVSLGKTVDTRGAISILDKLWHARGSDGVGYEEARALYEALKAWIEQQGETAQ